MRPSSAAAKILFTDGSDYTGVTSPTMQGAEPSLTFVNSATASTAAANYPVSFSVFNYGEVNMARLSAAGDCYYIRAIETQGPAPSDIPSTYYGHANGISCTGGTISGYSTSVAKFGGW